MRLGVSRIVNADSWKSALRELFLIVAGVLIALWAQDWARASEDRTREHATLRQLLSVTRENEQRAFEAASGDSMILGSILKLDATLAGDYPTDSLMNWMRRSTSATLFEPITGPYDAAAQTGGLNLIGNDSLRNEIARAYGEVRGKVEHLGQIDMMTLPAVSDFVSQIVLSGVKWYDRGAKLTPAQINTLQSDAEVFHPKRAIRSRARTKGVGKGAR